MPSASLRTRFTVNGTKRPTQKHDVTAGVAFVAAARFLGGQRFVIVISKTKMIHYSEGGAALVSASGAVLKCVLHVFHLRND
jgi:hypothetical protein